ncbi:efflux RND transporter periplasmic adaptor subunit [Parabacteroides sp. PF5-9]|uniref:efflux RND transporter periplasmic adaptor subunit n=1 Tax=Parabacteroides sp. PF5-9 TaxID=1742404 RepID=UPI0024758DFC|nr:efflux RND transporter periplasmic adaptor subunit [Parabacteroides sp. PF5-9]
MMKIQTTEKSLKSSYTASIRGKSDIDIYPQVSGYITNVCVEEGETVRKGQTLFIIDQVPYQAALRTATANVNLARANVNTAQLTYDSKQELFNKKVVSSFELQTAMNALESAKAQLDQSLAQEINAKNNLSYTVVKSPSDGVVGTLPFKIGTLVSPSQLKALTQISDNSQMYVYFSMTENQLLSLLREYQSVDNAIKSMPAIQLELSDKSLYAENGRVETISGVIESGTGAVSLRAVFPNPNGFLHSGGSGNVLIPSSHSECIVIPKSATFEVQDKIFVYRNIDGIAKSTMIEVAPVNEDIYYIVQTGLQPGDVILTEGVGFIRDNMPVQTKAIANIHKEETPLLGSN